MTCILKFGGTSVGSPESLENLVQIVRARAKTARVVVVVSALPGVTNALDSAALRGDPSIVELLRDGHDRLLHQLTRSHWNGSGTAVQRLLQFLEVQLRRPSERGSPQHDEILGIGERLSAPLVAEVLRARGLPAEAVDATGIVRTDATHGQARIDFEATRLLVRQRLPSHPKRIPVVTGFIGSTSEGIPTTLGRGGSDITAAILGAALDADGVEIWSDVDGVFASDPHALPGATLLPRLTHDEALERARAGARVLHPDTIPPLARRGIRLSVRNTFAPEKKGTDIGGPAKTDLIIAGATGRVGSALLRQLRALDPPDLRIRILANSRYTNDTRACSAVETDWSSTLRTLDPGSLFVDCTASAQVASLYETLVEQGVGVITANKLAGSGPEEDWSSLRRLAIRRRVPLRYETTAGAALPVLRTARDLAATGDRLHRIESVLSGTLSYILGRLHAGASFSEAVAEAQAHGFTEPDPRSDLSGLDVAAKLVILLREMAVEVELNDVTVEPLIIDDATWAQRASRAQASGNRLIYAGSWQDGIATARVEEVSAGHPFARLRPGENMVIFHTARYDPVPLTVAGPGAGPEVTAAGLLAEILEVTR